MKKFSPTPMRHALAVLTAGMVLGGLLGGSSHAGNMYRIPSGTEGGIPAAATVDAPIVTSTNSTLSWYGMEGWYAVEYTTNLTDWAQVGPTFVSSDFAGTTTVTNPNGAAVSFRLRQSNAFSGSGNCSGCHGDKYAKYTTTAHSIALSTLQAIGMGNNSSCLPCHTVGYGQQTGYTNQTLTPHLANVGCENCHGPAGWHKNSDHSLVRPAVSIDPAICGSCHQDSHHPTIEEYAESGHANVTPDVNYGFAGGVYYTNQLTIGGTNYYGYYVTTNADLSLKTNFTTGIISSLNGPQTLPNLWYANVYDPGQDRAASCGVCHSGATRMAMLNDYYDRLAGQTNALTMPTGKDSGAWGPTCANCHDPHGYYNTAQLRNPTWSSNYFTMPTTTDKRYIVSTNYAGAKSTNIVFYNTTFASLYNTNINICGQCHNTRGARWDGLSYGLLTNSVVTTSTNLAYVDIYTNVYTTNIVGAQTFIVTNSYVIGRYSTNLVSTTTNKLVGAGLTTNVTGYSRAPHHSPQYNMLTGILQPDYLNTTNGTTVYTNGVLTNGMGIYATHSGIAPRSIFNTNQCATCHVPQYSVNASTSVMGHTFEMDPNGCALGGCHTSGYPDWMSYQVKTTNNIARVADLLYYWSTNQGPTVLTTNYSKFKQNSWEFTTPGGLAYTNANVSNAGPGTADQLKLPADIRQARFNVYIAFHDGSYGVHNPRFTTLLLKDAENKVFNQLSITKFTASNPDVALNGTVTFTNLTSSPTGCSWDFGDGTGSNTTATVVRHVYTAVGQYSVTLTATNGVGSETLTRNKYVTVYDLPVASFTYTPGPLTHPATVTVTNTSVNADYTKWSFYDSSGYTASSNRLYGVTASVASFTYTNAGTYKIILQASNPGSSAYATNSITVN